jgi:hypothetical protein
LLGRQSNDNDSKLGVPSRLRRLLDQLIISSSN